jgi:hypothetical protein
MFARYLSLYLRARLDKDVDDCEQVGGAEPTFIEFDEAQKHVSMFLERLIENLTHLKAEVDQAGSVE